MNAIAIAIHKQQQSSDEEKLESCTIITTQANKLVAKVHEPMPVIIDPQNYDSWLKGNENNWQQLLKPYSEEKMQLRQGEQIS